MVELRKIVFIVLYDPGVVEQLLRSIGGYWIFILLLIYLVGLIILIKGLSAKGNYKF